MRRRDFLVLTSFGGLAAAGCMPTVPEKQQAELLVERSRVTVESFKERREESARLFRAALKDAQGVVVFPQVVKGAFLIGAEGGDGVLIARNSDGTWGYPAFYRMGAGSFGLQIGGQSSEVILILRSQGAVHAIVSYQGKLGADVQVAVGGIGAGMEASTTANAGADIVAYSYSAGLFGGLSVEGAVIGRQLNLNNAYYDAKTSPRSIVFENRFSNPQADGLRDSLVVG